VRKKSGLIKIKVLGEKVQKMKMLKKIITFPSQKSPKKNVMIVKLVITHFARGLKLNNNRFIRTYSHYLTLFYYIINIPCPDQILPYQIIPF